MEFGNFSPQAFEKLIQALCVKVLGPGVAIFGSGPDGAREATYTGKVPYPNSEERWKGYIVVQAKCKERLTSPAFDANWLCKQLKADLQKFLKRPLKKPQYYIIATNVTLSPEPLKGGKAKVEAVFEEFRSKLKLKSYAVWSADELRAFLQNDNDVRKSYLAWLTPSDVLAELLHLLRQPSVERLIPLALSRDIKNERDVRLRDAGQETEKSIFLEDVFIDLPMLERHARTQGYETRPINRSVEDEEAEEVSLGENQHGIVSRLVSRCADKLDPASLNEDSSRLDELEKSQPLRNRIVILGGPGQGKSTLGQFLAQFARARLLKQCDMARVDPKARDLIEPILERGKSEGITFHGPARFPLRIDLPRFADELKRSSDRDDHLGLMTYIAGRLSREIEAKISADQLRQWLGLCPSVFIFDGLDEVPPTGNRKSVVKAIDALWDDLCLVAADSLMVVTTRPQGYHNDLDRSYWEHWELAPLRSSHALGFANRLAEVRLSDPERRQVILEELTRAADDQATSLLMTSPLQVTILFGIALLKGAIPQDRWDLFQRYYVLLRDREAQKPSSDAILVRDFKRQIDALHQEAGFLLQVAAEYEGKANAFLTDEQFLLLVRRHLISEDFGDAEVASISTAIARIATDRLVLLASRIEGRIAFDVRSLQEFMAAALISSASSIALTTRLRAIASSAHWRHVFRIIASKVFSVTDLGHYRDEVVAICHSLDNGDLGDDGRLARAGARLAIDLLGDGIVSATPRYKKLLLRRAIHVCDIGSDEVDDRLTSQFGDDTRDVFREYVVSRVQLGDTIAGRGAWTLAFRIAEVDPAWFDDVLQRFCPKTAHGLLKVTQDSNPEKWTTTAILAVRNAEIESGPAAANEYLDNLRNANYTGSYDEDDAENLRNWPRDIVSILPIGARHELSQAEPLTVKVIGEEAGISFRYWPISAASEWSLSWDPGERAKWACLRAIRHFANEPNKESLATTLRLMEGTDVHEIPNRWRLPWLLDTLLHENERGLSFAEMADEAARGDYGDLRDWEAAEARWVESGITEVDLLSWNSGRLLTREIATRGVAHPSIWTGARFGNIRHAASSLRQIVSAIPHINAIDLRVTLLSAALSELATYLEAVRRRDGRVDETLIDNFFSLSMRTAEEADERSYTILIRGMFGAFGPSTHRGLLDRVSLLAADGEWFHAGAHAIPTLHAFNNNLSCRGLLSILAVSLHTRSDHELLSRIAELHGSAFDVRDDDTPAIATGAILLRIARGSVDEASAREMADLLLKAAKNGSSNFSFALGYIQFIQDSATRTSMLRALSERLSDLAEDDRAALIYRLSADLDSQPSGVSLDWQRDKLRLPSLPAPA